MKTLILGAAGQISRMLEDDLLEQTVSELLLYGRNVSSRLSGINSDRVTLIDGDYSELDKIKAA